MSVAEQSAEASLGRARPPAPVDGLVLGTVYASAAVVPDGTPIPRTEDPVGEYVPTARPGSRAPHLWLDDDHTRSTLDLFGRAMVLLVGPNGAPWHEQAKAIGGVPLEVQEMTHPGWPDLYGVGVDGAVPVRPDGFVAWRSAGSPADDDALALALRRVLGT